MISMRPHNGVALQDASLMGAARGRPAYSFTLRQFEVVEPSGLTRLVRILDYTPNAAVSAKTFRFTPPKGARVVDQSAMGIG